MTRARDSQPSVDCTPMLCIARCDVVFYIMAMFFRRFPEAARQTSRKLHHRASADDLPLHFLFDLAVALVNRKLQYNWRHLSVSINIISNKSYVRKISARATAPASSASSGW